MAGGASKGAARPGSAGYSYRHGWVPVAGSGAVDKRSKAKREAKPSAPRSPAAPAPKGAPPAAPKPAPRPRRPEFEELTDEQVKSRVKMYSDMASADDLSPDMRETVDKVLADLETEQQHRGTVDVPAPAPTPTAKAGAAKVEEKLRVTPTEAAAPPEHRDPEKPRPFKPTHTEVYHATSASNIASIRQDGFRQTTASGEHGAFFGQGTYFHTSKSDADTELAGYKMFIDPDMEQMQADVEVNNPFVVKVGGNAMDPGGQMRRAMVSAGLASPGEHLSPATITDRLKRAGHDGVEVKQDGYNPDIGGSQIVVFDAPGRTRPKPATRSDRLGSLPAMDVQTSARPR